MLVAKSAVGSYERSHQRGSRTRSKLVALPSVVLRAQNRAVDGQETRTAPLAKDARVCNRCRREPRIRGQRWCRQCRTAAQRDRRARMRVEGRQEGKAVGVLSGL